VAEMSREDVIERLRWIDREAHDEWVLVPAEREVALRHAIAALADLSRYKALVDRLAVLNNHEGDLRYVISPLLEEARALKEQS